MKTIQTKALLTAFLFMLIMMTSCQKEEQAVPAGQMVQKEMVNNENIPLPNLESLLSPQILNGPDGQEMAVLYEGIENADVIDILFDEQSGTFTSNSPSNNDFIKLLNSLNLTREQKLKLNRAMIEYRDCRTELYMKLKRVTQEILIKGNAEKRELYAKYKRGVITREQYQRALAELNKRVQNAINNSSERKRIIAAIEKCWETYVDHLRLILDKNQFARLMAWYKNHR